MGGGTFRQNRNFDAMSWVLQRRALMFVGKCGGFTRRYEPRYKGIPRARQTMPIQDPAESAARPVGQRTDAARDGEVPLA